MTNPFDAENTNPEEELEGTSDENELEVEGSLEEELYSDFDPDYDEYGYERDDDDDGEWHYEPPGPGLVESREPVDPSDYAAVVHDSFGERYVNIATLEERSASVTILRILGVLKLEPRGEVQYFLDSSLVSADHVVHAGQVLYMVGKLAGGR